MRTHLRKASSAAVAVVLLCATHGASARQPSVEERLERLERLFNSGTVVELLEQVTALQKELQELRGELELQSHTLSQIKERQRELYLDLDRRLRQAGAGGTAAPSPVDTPGQTPATTEAPSPPASPQPGATPAGGVDPLQEQNAYQEGFDLLKDGRYEAAIEKFQAFIIAYPRGQYTDNALYWLGEAYYVTRKFEPAIQAFQTLIQEHPASPKRTHALLKVGFSYDELDQNEAAEQVLKEIVDQHPNTTAARLAGERLQRLRSKKP